MRDDIVMALCAPPLSEVPLICETAGGKTISDERVEVALASEGHTPEGLLRSLLLEGR